MSGTGATPCPANPRLSRGEAKARQGTQGAPLSGVHVSDTVANCAMQAHTKVQALRSRMEARNDAPRGPSSCVTGAQSLKSHGAYWATRLHQLRDMLKEKSVGAAWHRKLPLQGTTSFLWVTMA